MTLSAFSTETTVPEHGLVSLSAAAWDEAKRRAQVLAPLAALATVPRATARIAAEPLGVSLRFVYTLLHRYRPGGNL